MRAPLLEQLERLLGDVLQAQASVRLRLEVAADQLAQNQLTRARDLLTLVTAVLDQFRHQAALWRGLALDKTAAPCPVALDGSAASAAPVRPANFAGAEAGASRDPEGLSCKIDLARLTLHSPAFRLKRSIPLASTLLPPKATMTDLSTFLVTQKWPAQHPDRLQLYSLPTPNGVKVSILLEETSLPYEAHLVSFETNDQTSPEFLSLNPNNKIPAILDPDGPGGKPLALFESGAILIYLAEKTGQLMPRDAAGRYETIQWLMFQMGGIGPMFGQVGFFHQFAGKDYDDKRPRDRYVAESKRLLGVLERRLLGRSWLMGDDYTIADIATFPWVRALVGFYDAGDLVGIKDYPNVERVLAAFVARPAVERGLAIPKRG